MLQTAALACVIIFANDMGAKVTREIRTHEIAHCAGWSHPAGDANLGKSGYQAYVPPKKFKFKGELIETSVSTSEARARCNGQLGCSTMITE